MRKNPLRALAQFSLLTVASLATLRSLAVPQPDGTPMQVTACGINAADKDADAKLEALRHEGVTSIETTIYWNKVEKTPGVLDWSEPDADVALFAKHGIKWVPFIATGCWYTTQDYVRNDPKMVMLRCLEHDRDTAIPSIWCPEYRDYVRSCYKKFAEHYASKGVIESVEIGVSGDYGEEIYPVIGNWPAEYHAHPGMWCGDRLAVADFRRHVAALYPGGVGDLNRAWHSRYASMDEVRPFIASDAPSERAWQELLRWYRGAMSEHLEYCMKTLREFFPNNDLYLASGGDMTPEHGSDFSAHAKIAAKFGAGMRISNESSIFPMNVALTRMVDTSCRFYGAYLGHEPASNVTPVGTLGRLFNSVTSGCRQFYMYVDPDLLPERPGAAAAATSSQFVAAHKGLMRTASPSVDVALYFPMPPKSQTKSDKEAFMDLSLAIRDFVDYDLVDDRLIEDGVLRTKSVLIVASTKVMDAATVARIRDWVRSGGVLFLLDTRALDWDGKSDAFDALVGLTPRSDEVYGITPLRVDLPKELPSVGALKDLYVYHGFTEIGSDCESLLSMDYSRKVENAWRRREGSGEVIFYYGPMDFTQRKENWMVSQRVPVHFMKDCLTSCVAHGTLKAQPATLNLTASDVYLVKASGSIWVLNMGNEAKHVEVGGTGVEIPPLSITQRPLP